MKRSNADKNLVLVEDKFYIYLILLLHVVIKSLSIVFWF